jgi:hypothetical protein
MPESEYGYLDRIGHRQTFPDLDVWAALSPGGSTVTVMTLWFRYDAARSIHCERSEQMSTEPFTDKVFQAALGNFPFFRFYRLLP